MPPIQVPELTTFLHRLEAATSRLEDIASATVEPPKANGEAPTPAPTGPLPPPLSAATPATEPAKALTPLLPQSVEEFDLFITGALKKFVNLSDEVGGPVAEQVGCKYPSIVHNQADAKLGIERSPSLCWAAEAYPHQYQGEEA
jgi:adenylyl cyclase-associated protein